MVISWDLNWLCALECCVLVGWRSDKFTTKQRKKTNPKMLLWFVLRVQWANLWKYPRDKYCALLVGKLKCINDCRVCICNCLDCAHLADSPLTPNQSQEQIPQLFWKKSIVHVPPKCLSLYRCSLNENFTASCDSGSTISTINCVI